MDNGEKECKGVHMGTGVVSGVKVCEMGNGGVQRVEKGLQRC